MEKNRQLYPLKFIPIPSERPWGGNTLITGLGKKFVRCDEDGNEIPLTENDRIGESWEIADMGFQDSVVAEGWLAGNTIGELMETYMERIVGEDIYNVYGRQFPLLIKFLDIQDKLSVQVHPDDEIASQRYDSLGKNEIWYIIDAAPDAKVYLGFNKDVTAQELYDRCNSGTVEEILNVIHPQKGDVISIPPGTVHAADKGLLIAEVDESSDLTFRLYDWGREFDPATARPMHLVEAMDFIDYKKSDPGLHRSTAAERSHAECHCGGGHEGHKGHEGHHHDDEVVDKLIQCREFTVNRLKLADPLHIYTGKFGRFIIYTCVEGALSIQVPSVNDKGEKMMDNYLLERGETVLIPADMPDFFLVPRDRDTVLLEAMVEKYGDDDDYIDPDTEPFLEGEDYEGLEDEHDGCDCGDE